MSDQGNFASATLKPGESYSFTFKAAGKYPYHDGLHPALKGSVTVTGPPPEVTLSAGAAILGYGGRTTLTGNVSSGDANDLVVITSNPFGAAAQQTATVTTGAGATTPTRSTRRSRRRTATWKATKSQSVTILVRPKVTLTRITGTRLSNKVRSSISYSGRYAFLQRRTSVGWITVKRLYLGPGSGRIFKAPRARGTRTYRVYLTRGQAGGGYLDSWSNSVRVHYIR